MSPINDWLFNQSSHLNFLYKLQSFLISTAVVALAEIGDKTQLLAFILAARFQKPIPIIMGIIMAVIANHTLAGLFGSWVSSQISSELLREILGAIFIGMAIWTLVPDELDEEETKVSTKLGVFAATFLAFFLAEMGDKTQVTTVALAANFNNPLWVIAGTTIGMLIADLPAVFVGEKFSNRISLSLIRKVAASLFASLGIITLIGNPTEWIGQLIEQFSAK